MDTVQILRTLCDVSSFLDVFPSDLLPQSIAQTSTTVTMNADPLTERFTLASHALPTQIFIAHYFDSYGIVPLVPSIQAFIKRNCATWEFNRRELHGLMPDVCGKYCCLFALYMDLGYTPKQFVSLFDACNNADRQVQRLFTTEFGAQMSRGAGVNAVAAAYKKVGTLSILIIPNLT